MRRFYGVSLNWLRRTTQTLTRFVSRSWCGRSGSGVETEVVEAHWQVVEGGMTLGGLHSGERWNERWSELI